MHFRKAALNNVYCKKRYTNTFVLIWQTFRATTKDKRVGCVQMCLCECFYRGRLLHLTLTVPLTRLSACRQVLTQRYGVTAIGMWAHVLMNNKVGRVAVRHVTYLTWWHVDCHGGHTSPGSPPAGRAGARLRRRTHKHAAHAFTGVERERENVSGGKMNVWTGNKRQRPVWTLEKLKITVLLIIIICNIGLYLTGIC